MSSGGLAEMRKASQLPDSPVFANHARSSELEHYATKGNWFTRKGIGCISLLIQRVKSEIPAEFYFTSRR